MMSGKRPMRSATTRLLQVMGRAADRHIQPDFHHEIFKNLAVFAPLDGLGVGSDHFDVVLLQKAAAMQLHRRVERGLASERRQQDQLALGAQPPQFLHFASNDLLHALHRDRLQVGAVGKHRVGHDRGRVRVDQNDPVTLFPEGLAGLRARIIKLAGLPDDDRTRADDENRMNVSAFRHKPAELKAKSLSLSSILLLMDKARCAR